MGLRTALRELGLRAKDFSVVQYSAYTTAKRTSALDSWWRSSPVRTADAVPPRHVNGRCTVAMDAQEVTERLAGSYEYGHKVRIKYGDPAVIEGVVVWYGSNETFGNGENHITECILRTRGGYYYFTDRALMWCRVY